MLSNRLRASLFAGLCVFLCVLAALVLFPVLLQYHPIQDFLLQRALRSYKIQRVRVTFSRAQVIFWRPVRIRAYDVQITFYDGEGSLRIKNLIATFDPKGLLHQRWAPHSLGLEGAQLTLNNHLKTNWAAKGSLATYIGGLLTLERFFLSNGRITAQWIPYTLTDLQVNVSRSKEVPGLSQVLVLGHINKGKASVFYTIRGKIGLAEKGDQPFGSLKLTFDSVPLAWFPLPPQIRVEKGRADLKMTLISDKDTAVRTSGTVAGRDLRFSVQRSGRKKVYAFSRLDLSFAGDYRKSVLHIPRFTLRGSGFSLKGDFSYGLRKGHWFAELDLTSPYMSFGRFQEIFPDPVVSPWFSEELFPSLSGGEVRIDHFFLTGRLEQIQHLELAQNASCIGLEISWKGMEALKNNRPWCLEGLSGTLSLRNGSLSVTDVGGMCGKSVVKNASLIIPSVYAPRLEPRISIDATMAFPDLLRAAEALFLSTSSLSGFFDNVRARSGLVGFHVEGLWSPSKSQFQMDSASFQFNECALDVGRIPIVLEQGSLQARGSIGYWFKGNLSLVGSRFDISGRADRDFETAALRAEGKGKLEELLAALGPEIPVKVKGPNANHYVISLTKSFDDLVCEAMVGLDGVSITSPMFSKGPGDESEILFFRFHITKGAPLCLDKAIWFSRDGHLEASAQYSPLDAMVEVKVSTPNMALDGVNLMVGGKVYRVSGQVTCDMRITSHWHALDKIRAFGKLEARGITVYQNGTPTLFKDCAMSLAFHGKGLDLNWMRMDVFGIPVDIRGRLKGWDRLTGRVLIHLNHADLRHGLVMRKKSMPSKARFLYGSLLQKANIRFSVDIAHASYGNMDLGSLTATGVFSRGNIHVERCRIAASHMGISLAGYLKRNPTPSYFFTAYIKAKDQPVQQLIKALGIKKTFLEGKLTMEALVSSQGQQFSEFISGLYGETNFVISKGKIIKSNVLIKVLDFLSVQKIFTKKPPDLSKEGFYFEEIKGNAEIKGGILRSDEVIMKSPVFNAIARGKVDLKRGKVKADLGAQPFVTIDSLLSKVPLVGYILTGKERALLVYYFKVRGPVTDPEVTYVPLKHMGKSIVLFFRRVFLTPVRIFKNLRRFAEKLSKMGRPLPPDEPLIQKY